MKNFLITDEEKQLILKRRELAAKRGKLRNAKPKNQVKTQEKSNSWDTHCDPSKVHKGRITEQHPLYWFEDEIFKKIGNLQHKEQHKKISKLLNMPVHNVFRDRVYHALTHLDALWEQNMLPLKYKIRYEKYKEKHRIGDSNVHPEHKKLKPDYKYPIPIKNRSFSFQDYPTCDETEVFQVGKKYTYKVA